MPEDFLIVILEEETNRIMEMVENHMVNKEETVGIGTFKNHT